MRIPIVADRTKEISAKYGVLLEDRGIALRGLFIIDDEGPSAPVDEEEFEAFARAAEGRGRLRSAHGDAFRLLFADASSAGGARREWDEPVSRDETQCHWTAIGGDARQPKTSNVLVAYSIVVDEAQLHADALGVAW